MTDYYEGAYRVTSGGVPCRVFHKGISAAERKEIEFAATVGLPMEFGSFRFEPSGDLLAKATLYRAKADPVPKTTTDYYAGAVRRVIDGVPCRLARIGKDTRHLTRWKVDGWDHWVRRAEVFRDELVRKGSYEAAGVEPPAPMRRAA